MENNNLNTTSAFPRIMAMFDKEFQDEMKKVIESEEFKNIANVAEKQKKLEEYEAEVSLKIMSQLLDSQKRFVHYDKLGYWGDKLIGGIVTSAMLIGGAALAMKYTGRKVDESSDVVTGSVAAAPAEAKNSSNPFTATERPIQPARGLKTV